VRLKKSKFSHSCCPSVYWRILRRRISRNSSISSGLKARFGIGIPALGLKNKAKTVFPSAHPVSAGQEICEFSAAELKFIPPSDTSIVTRAWADGVSRAFLRALILGLAQAAITQHAPKIRMGAEVRFFGFCHIDKQISPRKTVQKAGRIRNVHFLKDRAVLHASVNCQKSSAVS
jgi:hypothetical protein